LYRLSKHITTYHPFVAIQLGYIDLVCEKHLMQCLKPEPYCTGVEMYTQKTLNSKRTFCNYAQAL